jgi:hypothetical protein
VNRTKPIEIEPGAKRRAIIFLAVAGTILWVPVTQLLLGRPPGFLRNLGFFSGPSGTPLAWALGFLVAFAYCAYAIGSPLVARYWRAVSLLKLFAIVIAVAAAIVEEAFFRRIVMDGVMTAGGGPLLQILASALIFGGAHGIWGIVTKRIFVGIGVIVATGTLGAALAVVYLVGDRSLAPPIVAHFVITATIQPGILFAAFSGKMRW